MVNVDILNFAKNLADAELATFVAAYAIQANSHFAPAHGLLGVKLNQFPKGQRPTDNNWQLGFFDTADVADALGYHDVTAGGLPLGKVFVDTTVQAGDKVSVTGSHELLEMMGDPLIASVMQWDAATFKMFEMCDACEDDSFGYDINGVTVSDFCLTNWWIQGSKGPFDYMKHISTAGEILTNGYIGQLVLTGNEQWTQVEAGRMSKPQGRKVIRPGSRRERRMRARENWKRSTR